MNPIINSFSASLIAPGAPAAMLQMRGPATQSPRAFAGDSATGRALAQTQLNLALASADAVGAARAAAADLATYKQAAARYQYATEFAAAARRKALALQAEYEQISAQSGDPVQEVHKVQQAFTACKQAWQTASRAASDVQIAYKTYRSAHLQATVATSASRRAAAAEIAAVAACNHALTADDTATRSRQFTRLPQSLGARLSGYPALVAEVARSQAFRRSLPARLSAAG
jgi:hypothetical protein